MLKLDFLMKESGFTLTEVLVSAALLLLIALAFAPALLFVLENSEKNRIRTVATSLANEVIEELRTVPFDEIGLKDGNPGGEIEPVAERTVDGRKFQVKTFINWLELDEGGSASGDYKGIKVEVSLAGGAFAGKSSRVTAQTAVARDEAPPIPTGANIRVHSYRGWKEINDPDQPVNSLKVSVTDKTPGSGSIVSWTDAKGKALFIELREGTYEVKPDPAGLHPRMISLPGRDTFTVEVTEGATAELFVSVESPCSLRVTFTNRHGEACNISGQVILEKPFKDVNGNVLSIEETISNAFSVEFTDLWPVGEGYCGAYNLIVHGEGYDYNMSEDDNKPLRTNGLPWDGTFDGPGTSLSVTLSLDVTD